MNSFQSQVLSKTGLNQPHLTHRTARPIIQLFPGCLWHDILSKLWVKHIQQFLPSAGGTISVYSFPVQKHNSEQMLGLIDNNSVKITDTRWKFYPYYYSPLE